MDEYIIVNHFNYALFEAYIPEYLREDVQTEKNTITWVVLYNGVACGAAVCRYSGPEILLRYLFILEDFRGFGLGRGLLEEILLSGQAAGYSLLCVQILKGWSQPMEQFLYRFGFRGGREAADGEKQAEGPEAFSFRLGDLQKRDASFFRDVKMPQGVLRLQDVPDSVLHGLAEPLRQSGEDFLPLPIEKKDYEQEVSMLCMSAGKPGGILLLRAEGKKLRLVYVCTLGNGDVFRKLVMGMCVAISRKYGEDTVFEADALDEKTAKLIRDFSGISGKCRERLIYSL